MSKRVLFAATLLCHYVNNSTQANFASFVCFLPRSHIQTPIIRPRVSNRRLIEKNMLSLLIYTFPNKVEQGSLLVSLASQQFLGCHVTLLGERCVTSKKRLRGRLGSLSAQFLAVRRRYNRRQDTSQKYIVIKFSRGIARIFLEVRTILQIALLPLPPPPPTPPKRNSLIKDWVTL